MKSILVAAVLAVPCFAAAEESAQEKAQIQQTRTDIQRDREDVQRDRAREKQLDAEHADAMKDIASKEKAAKEAVRGDSSLTREQKEAGLRAINEDFKARRKAVNEKFRSDKAALHADVKRDHHDIRRDERKLREEKRELRRETHGKR